MTEDGGDTVVMGSTLQVLFLVNDSGFAKLWGRLKQVISQASKITVPS